MSAVGDAPTRARPPARRRRRPRPLRWPLLVGMSLLAASAVFPILFMLQAALRTQAEWDDSNIGLPT